MTPRIAPCIWYDGTAEQAAAFYAATFPDSSVDAVHRAPLDLPSIGEGDVLMVEFTVCGAAFLGLNGGPGFPQTQAVSFQVYTDDQAKPIGCGMRSSAAAAPRTPAAGAGTAGASTGRSRRAR